MKLDDLVAATLDEMKRRGFSPTERAMKEYVREKIDQQCERLGVQRPHYLRTYGHPDMAVTLGELFIHTEGGENPNEQAGRVQDALDLFDAFLEQDLKADRRVEQGFPPWPDQSDTIFGVIVRRALREVAENPEAGVIWLAATAWFEGGLAERARNRS